MPRQTTPLRILNTSIVVGYVRVSTTAERQELGLAAQEAAIKTWAAANGKTVARIFLETVTGGAPLDRRPVLLECIGTVAALSASGLVVARLDRFSRDPLTAALAETELRKHGACLLCAEGPGSGDDPTSELIRGILFSVARFEKALIRARIKAALAVKRSRGDRLGAPPYGFRVAEDKQTLVPNPDEAATVDALRSLRASGMTIRAVRDAATERGLLSRVGKPFAVAAVHRILARTRTCACAQASAPNPRLPSRGGVT